MQMDVILWCRLDPLKEGSYKLYIPGTSYLTSNYILTTPWIPYNINFVCNMWVLNNYGSGNWNQKRYSVKNTPAVISSVAELDWNDWHWLLLKVLINLTKVMMLTYFRMREGADSAELEYVGGCNTVQLLAGQHQLSISDNDPNKNYTLDVTLSQLKPESYPLICEVQCTHWCELTSMIVVFLNDFPPLPSAAASARISHHIRKMLCCWHNGRRCWGCRHWWAGCGGPRGKC